MAGIFKTFSHKLKPKQIHGMCGLDGPTGKPGVQRPAQPVGHSVSVTRPEVGDGKPQASHAPDRHEPHNVPAPPLDPPPFCLLQRVQYSTFRRARGLGRSSKSRSSRSRQSLRPRASARRTTPQSVSCFARRSGSREPTVASRKRSQRRTRSTLRRSAVSRATPSTTRVARCHPHALALILALALIRTLALTLKVMVVALILALALIRTPSPNVKGHGRLHKGGGRRWRRRVHEVSWAKEWHAQSALVIGHRDAEVLLCSRTCSRK